MEILSIRLLVLDCMCSDALLIFCDTNSSIDALNGYLASWFHEIQPILLFSDGKFEHNV